MVRAGKDQRYADGGNILKIGRTYMRDAERSEMESDYIAAEGIYHICCEMFSALIQQKSSCEKEAKGEYMHALFRCAMLPQIDDTEKMQCLDQALELASGLEKETGDMEYTIAAGCIREELDELSRNLQKQTAAEQKQMSAEFLF
ncbi:MAG: hypothetical protein PUG60_11885 [Lachnospiraceae bacterium]|nr:hypothetical protein [Lachnospiraceae bacterium]MDY4970042.1 hypothetical protein [Lachnospiraceae bacterium]